MKRDYNPIYIIILVAFCYCRLSAQPIYPPTPTELKYLTDSIQQLSTKPVKGFKTESLNSYFEYNAEEPSALEYIGILKYTTTTVYDSTKTIYTVKNDPKKQKKIIETQTIFPTGKYHIYDVGHRIVFQQQVIDLKTGDKTTISKYGNGFSDTAYSIRNLTGKLVYLQAPDYELIGDRKKVWFYPNGNMQKETLYRQGSIYITLYDTTGEFLSLEECHPERKCTTTMLRKKTGDETFVFYRFGDSGDTLEKRTTVYLNGKTKKQESITSGYGQVHTETETYDYDYKTGNITSYYKVEDADTTEQAHWLYDYRKKKVIYFYISYYNDYQVSVERTDTTRKGKTRTISEYEPLLLEKQEANKNPKALLSRFVPRHIHSADTTIGKPVYTAYTPANENRSYFDSSYYDKNNRLIRNANYVYERDEEHKKRLIAREIRTFNYAENSNSYTFRKTSLDPQYNWSSSRVYNGKLLISLDSTAMNVNFKENHSYDAAGHLLRREHRELKDNKLIRGWGETYSYTSTGQVLEHRAFTFETDGSEKTLWVIKNTWDGKLPLEQHITYGDGKTTRTFKCEYEFY